MRFQPAAKSAVRTAKKASVSTRNTVSTGCEISRPDSIQDAIGTFDEEFQPAAKSAVRTAEGRLRLERWPLVSTGCEISRPDSNQRGGRPRL